ncbi:MAG: hypothetical protein GX677_08615 [Treponema sp.]|nr:hypothetical protein [Treponema sp.]
MATKKTKKKRISPKKGKVYIPPYKIIILCLSIIAICIFFLLISNIASLSNKKTTQDTITERFEDKIDTTNNQKDTKNETAKIETQKDSEQQKKEESPKPVPQTPIPEQTEDKKQKIEPQITKKTSFEAPVAKNNAQLVFVFDDGGQNLSQLDKFLKLPFKFTVAVLPKLKYSIQAAQKTRQSGNEVILHQPMQSINLKINPGEGAIKPDMTEEQIKSLLIQNIFEIAPIAGINNHEGSLITSDKEKMAVVLQVASQEGLYFLDSRTTSDTAIPEVAKQLGYSFYERNVFLDNTKTKENILNEISNGLDIANKNGVAIMIGHVWSADVLPDILNEIYPELIKKGYTFSTVSNSSALRF